MHKLWTRVAAVLLMVLICSWWWQHTNLVVAMTDIHKRPDMHRASVPNEPMATRADFTEAAHVRFVDKQRQTFAASLRGTVRDGTLRADAQGNLIIERGIRDLFDYYLTTLGESDLNRIRNHMRAQFKTELPEPAATQAAQLLDAYLDYRQRAGELEQLYPQLTQENATTLIADYFAARDALRYELFDSDVVDVFFQADSASEQAALAAIGHESAAQKADAFQNGYARYRVELKSTDDNSRDALRAQLFGNAAAQRLTALDRKRDAWNTRLASYREQKRELLAAAQATGADASVLVQQLQQRQFSEHERRRVRALDELEINGVLRR